MATGRSRKRDSALTRAKILSESEKLFSDKGFDGTRVDDIAAAAGVNKALIYYYFKSKDDILDSLFTSAITDVIHIMEQVYEDWHLEENEIEEIFHTLIDHIQRKKRIIAVILMESLKSSKKKPYIFKIADYFIGGEVDTLENLFRQHKLASPDQDMKKQMMITEFFTGIMPIINYVVFADKCRHHFKMSERELRRRFYEALKMTHIAYHFHYMKKMGIDLHGLPGNGDSENDK